MANPRHPIRFPGEGEAYRTARNALLEAELDLRARLEEVAALRRRLPLGGKVPEDYAFEEPVGGPGGPTARTVRLSELFEPEKRSLIVYSFMYGPDDPAPCPMCTSFLDGLDGLVPHITQRVNLAVAAKSPIARIREWAAARGWRNLRLLSSAKTRYNADYAAETPEGAQLPACNVFVKRPDGVYHFYAAELLYVPTDGHPRHMDLLWPLWNFFDLTPEGRGNDWAPRLSYDP